MTITISYLILAQVCNFHTQIYLALFCMATIFEIFAITAMFVRPPNNCYKMANNGRIIIFNMSIDV